MGDAGDVLLLALQSLAGRVKHSGVHSVLVPAAMPEAPEGALATCLPLLKRRWFAVSISGCLARRTLLVGWFLGRLLLAQDVLRPGRWGSVRGAASSMCALRRAALHSCCCATCVGTPGVALV